MSGKKIVAGMREAVERAKQDVADAVAIHKEAYRAGWIAGRDAAAEVAFNAGCSNPDCGDCYGHAIAEAIRQLRRPA